MRTRYISYARDISPAHEILSRAHDIPLIFLYARNKSRVACARDSISWPRDTISCARDTIFFLACPFAGSVIPTASVYTVVCTNARDFQSWYVNTDVELRCDWRSATLLSIATVWSVSVHSGAVLATWFALRLLSLGSSFAGYFHELLLRWLKINERRSFDVLYVQRCDIIVRPSLQEAALCIIPSVCLSVCLSARPSVTYLAITQERKAVESWTFSRKIACVSREPVQKVEVARLHRKEIIMILKY